MARKRPIRLYDDLLGTLVPPALPPGFGGAKVADGFWIKGQEAIPRMLAALDAIEVAMAKHEYAHYGKNRRTRRQNRDYQLHVQHRL